jgi:lysophospholipase L1-like esterase
MSANGLPPAEAAGARHFRKLVLAVAIAYFSVLAIECVHQYLTCLRAAPTTDDIYNGMQQRSTLIYYLFWFGLSAVALAAASLRRTTWLSLYLCLLLVAETASYVYFFATHLHLYHPPVALLYSRFEPHPFVVAVPHPGVFGQVTHDENHRRTTINEGKQPNPKLVYVFGGSTTYDVGNADADTWPTQLSRLLGPGFAVENFAVPAFSSVENMAQSLFAFRDVAPACAVYYEGWNDLRMSHIKDLAADYANYEYPALVGELALGPHPGFLERNSVLVAYILSAFATPQPTFQAEGNLGDRDPRLAMLYRDNIRLIAAFGKSFGVRVIFIPQVLDYDRLTKDTRPTAVPYIIPKDMKKLMGLMNDDLASAAAQSQAYFLPAPLAETWGDEDFVDEGHFNPTGALKFARSIAGDIRRICG